MARMSLVFMVFAVMFAVELMHNGAEGQGSVRDCLSGCAGFSGGVCGDEFCRNNTRGPAAAQLCQFGCTCLYVYCTGACYADYPAFNGTILSETATVPKFENCSSFYWAALGLGNRRDIFSGSAANGNATQ